MGKTVGIVDYSMGNLHSVKNALDYLGVESFISGRAEELERADALILPGVGAFPDAMRVLRRGELPRFLRRETEKKPLLGICLGMQILFERGFEFEECEGLGLIKGEVVRMRPAPEGGVSLKIPHMGWNDLHLREPCPLFRGLPEGSYVYFVHSYHAVCAKPENLAAVTCYGGEVTAAVQCGNVFGTQFHPEKSEAVGLQILRNFCDLAG